MPEVKTTPEQPVQILFRLHHRLNSSAQISSVVFKSRCKANKSLTESRKQIKALQVGAEGFGAEDTPVATHVWCFGFQLY